ncbi:hypothetical protein HELRODRAFT_74448 [Helobdella robusta]|uniref:Protein kinase domain-containing protein n=1 Tax=Helobdella robusta TaxID=6412 RepID=T1G1R3_HELRO|nr:hypothetical protein HELRODRAFT_74448 [Helobdella robusta]ESO08827.1 hypothetical protein HELRODRAFT_74448 [Helobdella robusta]
MHTHTRAQTHIFKPGTYNDTTDVAIKTLIPEKSNKEKFLEEAKFLQKMNHKNMVQIMGVCSEGEPVFIIMEFVELGSLRNYLHNDRGKTIKFKTLLDIAAQIASGMTYIEQNNFIHRDLRSVNCLVGRNKAIKIADFGLAKIQEIYNANAETPFPVRWTPPEAIEFQRFSIKSDVWSYGVVLFELVTYGESPYEREAFLNDGKRLSNPSVKFTKQHKKYYCPDSMYKKMLDCWNKNPDKRPTFVKLSEFFESFYESCEEDD